MTQSGLLVEKPRISSIDLVRGIVMVIMALDHTRDFFHESAFIFDPTDPQRASGALFFTRWITHFCAPTFVLLSGTSIRISLQRKSKKEMSRFLWTRGLWLVFLEFTVVRFSFFFNLYYDFTVVQVIFALGASMIFMAALIHLKDKVLFILGVVIVAGHNIFDSFPVGPDHPLFKWITMIYQAGPMEVAPGKFFMVGYPFLPWLGIMLLGYSLGQWYLTGFDTRIRQTLLIRVGLFATLLFVVLRAVNVYGDTVPWTTQETPFRTFLSFMNTTKYPVSLCYTLMTIGPTLVVLAFVERVSMTKWKPIEVFGRVPMFYYLLHFYLIHVLAIATFLIVRHKTWADLDFHFVPSENFFEGPPKGFFGGVPIGAGYSLPVVYTVWISVVLLCYPLCKMYNKYKSTHNQWWLSYL